MLSAGIGLYMIEPVSHMSLFWACFSYTATTVWILFNWLYVRPRSIKKQSVKLNVIIGQLEQMNEQMNKAD
jgi:hypothetical protein